MYKNPRFDILDELMMSPVNKNKKQKTTSKRKSSLPPILKGGSALEMRSPQPKSGLEKLAEKRSSSVMQSDRENSSITRVLSNSNINSIQSPYSPVKRNNKPVRLPSITSISPFAARRKKLKEPEKKDVYKKDFLLCMDT